MELIGTIKLLQIQLSPMKVGERPNRRYEPSILRVMPTLSLAQDGVFGLSSAGETIVDAHHGHHPKSRNKDNINGLSFNFTSHYQSMQAQFGAHMIEGCAGENILIACDDEISLDDLGTRLAIRSADSDQVIYLTNLKVAAPCVEFSHFAIHHPDPTAEEVREALRFLDDGKRGFYAVSEQDRVEIRAGDSVYRLV